jgi:hypothetical protein
LESLAPEERPIAEQVLRGGIPAVRTALHLEREKALAEGRAAPKTDELIAMAESLLPRLKAAEWRDRAEAAAADVDSISLRDLRSVVTGSEVARDEETRALATTLREALETRIRSMQEEWSGEISKLVDDGRVVRAVRLSSRPPEPSARLPVEVADRLATAAGEAMSPDCSSDLWAALLDAVAASPIRRSVVPTGLPDSATPDLRKAAHQQSGNIPALAKLLGVTIPPPPQPGSSRRRTEGTGRAARRGPRADHAAAEPGPHPQSAGPGAAPPLAPGATAEAAEPVEVDEMPVEPEIPPTSAEVSEGSPAETAVAADTSAPVHPEEPAGTSSPADTAGSLDTPSISGTAGGEPAGPVDTGGSLDTPSLAGTAGGEPAGASGETLGDLAPGRPDDEEEVVGSAER